MSESSRSSTGSIFILTLASRSAILILQSLYILCIFLVSSRAWVTSMFCFVAPVRNSCTCQHTNVVFQATELSCFKPQKSYILNHRDAVFYTTEMPCFKPHKCCILNHRNAAFYTKEMLCFKPQKCFVLYHRNAVV